MYICKKHICRHILIFGYINLSLSLYIYIYTYFVVKTFNFQSTFGRRGGGNTLLKNPSDCALFGDVVDVAVGNHGQTTEILLWNANHLGSNGRQLAEDAKLKPNIGVKDIIVDFHYPPQNEVISHLGKINITYKSGKGYVPTMFGDLLNVGANG